MHDLTNYNYFTILLLIILALLIGKPILVQLITLSYIQITGIGTIDVGSASNSTDKPNITRDSANTYKIKLSLAEYLKLYIEVIFLIKISNFNIL